MTLEEFLQEWNNPSPYVRVHTSGSTGEPKSMLVEKQRMEASARMTCSFLGLQEGDTALLCMPLDYIAGKMMVVRALTCGLRLVSVPPSGHPLANSQFSILNCQLDFAAMVPMQLWNTLQVPEERERLRQVRHLLIGGGAIDSQLADALQDFPGNVWSSYGMTETLSHIALCRLNGPERSDWYTPLPGVTVSLNAEGCLVIDAPHVCSTRLVTNDLAELKPDSTFRILGRRDNVVCSGGVKIQMEAVEEALRPHLAIPFMITKCPDPKFGEVVAMLIEDTSGHDARATNSQDSSSLVEHCRSICQRVLPKYEQPKRFLVVERLPLTETGKPARLIAQQLMADRNK